MKKRMTSIIAGIFLSATGAALGQLHQPSGQKTPGSVSPYLHQSAGVNLPPLAPAQKAKIAEITRLDDAAATALDNGQYGEAEADAQDALSLGLDSGIAQEMLASSLNAQGKSQEALKAYEKIAREGSVFPRNMLPYALLLLKTGHYAQAVAVYNKQLPYLAEGELMVANSHFSTNMPQPRQLATALHIALGLTYGSSASWGKHSQDDKALAEFQKAQALTPDSALAYLYYGHQLRRMGHKAEAQTALARAAELGQGDVKAAAEQALLRRH